MLRLILVVIFIIGFLVIRFLPWWISLCLGIALILLSRFLLRELLFWLVTMPFRAKGRVLHGATADVHSVRPIPSPRIDCHPIQRQLGYDGDNDDWDDGSRESARYPQGLLRN